VPDAPARWHRGLDALAVIASLGLAACAVAPEAGGSASGAAAPQSVEQIAPGVYLAAGRLEDWGPDNHGRVANTGFIVGERCVAVIDSGGTRSHGAALKAAVRRTTALPVCYVINTHAHPDHLLGNEAFVEDGDGGPQFVGHRRLPVALAARGPFYLNALRRDFGGDDAHARLIAPTLVVESTLDLDLGGRRLSLKAWPTAHTDADLSVLDAATGTLWLGDLLFVDHTPVLDGRLKGWLAALTELRSWPVAIVVPGHGPPSRDWPAALDAQQHYLERLQHDTRRALRERLTLAEAIERIAPDRPGWRLLDHFHRRNVTAAYAELEWDE
jgi:quinoprotein relay system zinc metallohydrolase 2